LKFVGGSSLRYYLVPNGEGKPSFQSEKKQKSISLREIFICLTIALLGQAPDPRWHKSNLRFNILRAKALFAWCLWISIRDSIFYGHSALFAQLKWILVGKMHIIWILWWNVSDTLAEHGFCYYLPCKHGFVIIYSKTPWIAWIWAYL
jgi:hypothetical protein